MAATARAGDTPAALDMPCVRHRTVWHVGTLAPADKGCRGMSHEGAGLSVSQHPEAWVCIARLGGLPRHLLQRHDGQPGVFVDAHGLSPAQQQTLVHWGCDEGWVRPAVLHVLQTYDSEEGGWSEQVFADEPGMLAECDPGLLAAGEMRRTRRDGVEATPRLVEQMGFRVDPLHAEPLLLTLWAAQHPMLDGVWWNDRLEVAALSAPRGVIVPERIERWAVRPGA